jgi:hypothetical protein
MSKTSTDGRRRWIGLAVVCLGQQLGESVFLALSG